MNNRFLSISIIILTALYSCSTSRPKDMLEFYYSIPFGDKYNDVLSREDKEKLFKAGKWEVQEDSGYAKLNSTNDQSSSEEIVLKVWDNGNVVAVTTLYDEGSDCPPINELSLFRFSGNTWEPIEIPPIEITDFWEDKAKVPEKVISQSGLIEFEPFLNKTTNGIRFEWRYYTCFDGDVEDVPDYFENEGREIFLSESNQRDYNELVFLWDNEFRSLEKSTALVAREKTDDFAHQSLLPWTGLLLGLIGGEGPITYFITFSDSDINIKNLNGAILSPQQDNFYVIQSISAVSSKTCSYDSEGETVEEECTSSASKLLISRANRNDYNKAMTNIVQEVSSMAVAECGISENQFEDISFIGKNFIQYVMGGSDSECAPDGPGGGFEKDTIVSFNGGKISMLASAYLSYSDLQLAHGKLFPTDARKNNVLGFCEPEELLINMAHENGNLMLHARNNSGRGYQDSWERDIMFSEAPDVFTSKDYKPVQNKAILDGSTDHFVSPDGKYVVIAQTVREERRLYFHNASNPVALARISIPDASIVMEEWCDKSYWLKWSKAIDDASGFIQKQNLD